jgi:GntR family transcriptional regulator / MocR family aminotransferase
MGRSPYAAILDLDPDGPGPLHVRLTRAVRAAIRDGRLAVGNAVPPSRALAEELGCSRWVVTEAYGQLVAEGYLVATVGSATRVAWTPSPATPRRRVASRGAAAATRYDLSPGLPDLRGFPRQRWAEAVRTVAGDAAYYELGVPDPNGHPDLRSTMADYLSRARGADIRDAALHVTAGVTDGLVRVCRALAQAGHTAVGVEDPGWGRLRSAVAAAGLHPYPIGVDRDGVRVSLLDSAVRAVVVGPAHQFPTGATLPPARRAALVRWAREVDGVVLEDDYDAEFRYDRAPVAVFQGLDPGRVFLLGSVSKTLSPSLGIGWLVAPGSWAAAVRAANPVAQPPPVLDQLALARFIGRGSYDAHLRAARRRYRARRDVLLAALTSLGLAPAPAVAGLHVLLPLPRGVRAAGVVSRAAALGVRVMDLAAYRMRPGKPGLVLGYGNIADRDVPRAVALLAEAIG